MGLQPTDAIPTAVAGFGTALVIIMLLSQAPLYRSTYLRTGSLEALSVAPLLGMYSNMGTWTVYGFAQADMNVIRVNLAGLAIAVAFMAAQLLLNAPPARARVARIFALGAGAVTALDVGLFLALRGGMRTTALGYVGVVFNVGLFASPLLALRTALKSMDATALPVLLVFANNLCSLNWGAYGWLVSNYFIMIPNVIGTVINLAQLAGTVYILTSRPASTPLADADATDLERDDSRVALVVGGGDDATRGVN